MAAQSTSDLATPSLTIEPLMTTIAAAGSGETNGTTATEDPFSMDSGLNLRHALPVLFLSLAAIVPNLVVVMVLATSVRLRSCYDCLVLNMSLVNAVTVTVIGTIAGIKYLRGVYPGRWETCYVQAFAFLLNPVINLLCVTALSVERYVALNKPFFYRIHISRSSRLVVLLLAVIWSVALMFACSPHFTSEKFILGDAFCQPLWSGTSNAVLGRVSSAIAFVLVAITITLSILTIKTIWRLGFVGKPRKRPCPTREPSFSHQAEITRDKFADDEVKRLRERWQAVRLRRRASISSDESHSMERDAASVTIMIVVVTVVFVICFIPLLVRFVLETGERNANSNATLAIVTRRLLLLNAILNPFLFCLLRRVYRAELKDFLSRVRRGFSICRWSQGVRSPQAANYHRRRRPSQQPLTLVFADANPQAFPRLAEVSDWTSGRSSPNHSSSSDVIFAIPGLPVCASTEQTTNAYHESSV